MNDLIVLRPRCTEDWEKKGQRSHPSGARLTKAWSAKLVLKAGFSTRTAFRAQVGTAAVNRPMASDQTAVSRAHKQSRETSGPQPYTCRLTELLTAANSLH